MNYYWLGYLAVFLAAVFFIRRLNIFVGIVYFKKPDNHSLNISFWLFKRLRLYTFQISPSKFFTGLDALAEAVDTASLPMPETGGSADNRAADEILRDSLRGEGGFNLYRRLLGKLAASLVFEKFRVNLVYGTEDAALTGVSNGILAALRGVFLAVCASCLNMKGNPDISFSPVYGDNRLEIEFNCIFTIKLGNVIAIAAKALAVFCVGADGFKNKVCKFCAGFLPQRKQPTAMRTR